MGGCRIPRPAQPPAGIGHGNRANHGQGVTKGVISQGLISKGLISQGVISQGGLGPRGRPVAAQQVAKELAPASHQAAKQGLAQGPIGPAGIADHP